MISHALHEIHTAIDLPKCQQCGCMRETLDQILLTLPQLPPADTHAFRTAMPAWQARLNPPRYTCLGCDPCYAGAAQNAFTSAFPQVAASFGLSCDLQINPAAWPPVVGEYLLIDPDGPAAIVTLASLDLPKRIAERIPQGVALAGKLETENIGIDKLIKNVIASPRLRCLIIAGTESAGHHSGQTLLALAQHGIDATGRIIGSTGKRPVLRNVTPAEVETFRQQIQIIDLIGCEDLERIAAVVQEVTQQTSPQPITIAPCGCSGST